MWNPFYTPQSKEELQSHRRVVKRMAKAFVLVEVLLSMTVLAVAGTALLRSIQNSINASRKARDTAKLIFLAKSKVHEYEMLYSFKPLPVADLGTFSEKMNHDGLRDYIWTVNVDYNQNHDAYFITVWVSREQNAQQNWYNRRNPEGFKLVSMVPTGRFNEYIQNGYQSTKRGRGRR